MGDGVREGELAVRPPMAADGSVCAAAMQQLARGTVPPLK
jgi:hypothetical protein